MECGGAEGNAGSPELWRFAGLTSEQITSVFCRRVWFPACSISIYRSIYLSLSLSIYIYIYFSLSLSMYVCMHTYIYIYIYVCIYIYIYIYFLVPYSLVPQLARTLARVGRSVGARGVSHARQCRAEQVSGVQGCGA